ncbi:hypothetical protein OHB12_01210 [Nocardia sp. NBC_01730]|uniref:hypothetical protein n=1 Tax=Nocardia sp. NBC_01730 TaxID=2975998 RepID=UPI002E0DE9E5|nr:hypothetical protein OHB12_01210 [Nocardia sp. NBC_01730]
MVQSTPWQASKTPDREAGSPSRAEDGSRRRQFNDEIVLKVLDSLRGYWGYLFAAAGSILTFALLFQPWLDAKAADGGIKANPFGKLQISSSLVALWSGSPPPPAHINGMWAVLAAVASAVTVFAVVINLRARSAALSYVAVGSSVAMAIFVVLAVVNLNGQASAVRGMLSAGSQRDLGTQVGQLIRWASGNGRILVPGAQRYSYVTAGLTSVAWFTVAIAVVSAVAALGQWVRGRTAGSGAIRLPRSFPIVFSGQPDETQPARRKGSKGKRSNASNSADRPEKKKKRKPSSDDSGS